MAQSEPIHHAGPESLDDHIRGARQCLELHSATIRLQIEANAALVPRHRGEYGQEAASRIAAD